jgi:hypothetical protein
VVSASSRIVLRNVEVDLFLWSCRNVLVALAQSGSGEPWNKGKLVGQKAPLRLKEIWAIRIRLQLAERRRDPALFNLAVDSKLRSCDLVTLQVRDITHGERIAARAIVMQLRRSARAREN